MGLWGTLMDFRGFRDLRVLRALREAFGVSQKKRTFALIKDSEYFFPEVTEYFFSEVTEYFFPEDSEYFF